MKVAAQQSLQDVLARMTYWEDVRGGSSVNLAAKGKQKYLIIEQDGAGVNNKRICWEMAGVVALHTGRTLVLPPSEVWWAIDKDGTTTKTEDFVNLDQLRGGLSVLTFKEFAQREQKALNLPNWTVQDELTDQQKVEWKSFAVRTFKMPGTDKASYCDLDTYNSDDAIIYADHDPNGRFLYCNRWYDLGQPEFTEAHKPWPVPNSAYSLLRNHFVWHKDVFELAAPIVHRLGLFQYVAMHARFGDFRQFAPDQIEPADSIVSKWVDTPSATGAGSLLQTGSRRPRNGFLAPMSSLQVSAQRSRMKAQAALRSLAQWVKPGSVLYIATDEADEKFLRTFRDHGIDAHWAPDFFRKADSPIAHLIRKDPVRAEKLMGAVEQVICAFGQIFLGTKQSTFTGYITRLRIYADAPQTGLHEDTRLFHTATPTPETAKLVDQSISHWKARHGMWVLNRTSPGVF